MKTIKRLLIFMLILSVIATTLIFVPKPKYERTNPFISDHLPLVMAHAGGKGVYPDNTILAYQYAFDLGVDVLEMDVQLTQDDVLVLLHGQNNTGNTISHSNCDVVVWEQNYDDLYQNCNFGYNYQEADGTYLYRDMTNAQWQDAKVYLPTLDEVFTLFGKNTLYNIEIKADADAPREKIADQLYDLIEAHDLIDYVLVAVAFDDISAYLINTYPDLYVSTSYGSAQSLVISIYTLTSVFKKASLYAAVQVPTSYNLPVIQTIHLDTRFLVNTLHQHNIAMHYWTINDPDEMRHLIEIGADGIITDYPELLMDILSEYT
jgi:glycerophosphoryl diester phosphodiesterase